MSIRSRYLFTSFNISMGIFLTNTAVTSLLSDDLSSYSRNALVGAVSGAWISFSACKCGLPGEHRIAGLSARGRGWHGLFGFIYFHFSKQNFSRVRRTFLRLARNRGDPGSPPEMNNLMKEKKQIADFLDSTFGAAKPGGGGSKLKPRTSSSQPPPVTLASASPAPRFASLSEKNLYAPL